MRVGVEDYEGIGERGKVKGGQYEPGVAGEKAEAAKIVEDRCWNIGRVSANEPTISSKRERL